MQTQYELACQGLSTLCCLARQINMINEHWWVTLVQHNWHIQAFMPCRIGIYFAAIKLDMPLLLPRNECK